MKNKEKYFLSLERQRDFYFKKMYRQLNVYFEKFIEDLSKLVEKETTDFEAVDKKYQVKLRNILFENYEEIVNHFAKLTFQMLNKKKANPIDVWTGIFLSNLENNAGKKIKGINETVLSYVRRELVTGAEAGEGSFDIAQRLRQNVGFPKNRAMTVARTEVVSVSNGASLETAKFVDENLKKIWITTIDGRERPWHADADGQVVGIKESFLVNGENLEYPGDSMGSAENVINCRCAIAFEK